MDCDEWIVYSRKPGYTMSIYESGEVEIESGMSNRSTHLTDQEFEDLNSSLDNLEENQLPFWRKMLGYASLEVEDETFEWGSTKPEYLEEVVEILDHINLRSRSKESFDSNFRNHEYDLF